MPAIRRRSQLYSENKGGPPNGLYIHSSPPRVLQMSSAYIRQLIRSGDIEKLEQVVLEGHGKKLVGEYSADYKTRMFLKSIPNLMTTISQMHDAVNSGRLEELQSILEDYPLEKRKKLVLAKDESGVGLLHKAVYYDLKSIYKWLIEKFPHMVSIKDSEGRTAYHYTAMCKDKQTAQKLLTCAGVDTSALDNKQHSAKYYLDHVQELELPNAMKSARDSRRSIGHRDSLNFKKSNIRIWIHQRNLANLQQVVWEGHGSKLLVEHSNNPKIRKFLEAVPHIMGLIKDIHNDVISDDIEGLRAHTSGTIPPIVLSGKDTNGLSALHKAAGLGKQEIAEYIVGRYPQAVHSTDNEGRTPLHYAALLKDEGKMTNFLISNGADESALDDKQKTAAYYKNRPSELDSKLLCVIPECPRSAKDTFASHFDWSLLSTFTPMEDIMKPTKRSAESEKIHDAESPKEEPIKANGHAEVCNEVKNDDVEIETNEPAEEDEEEKECQGNGDSNNNEVMETKADEPREKCEEKEETEESTEKIKDNLSRSNSPMTKKQAPPTNTEKEPSRENSPVKNTQERQASKDNNDANDEFITEDVDVKTVTKTSSSRPTSKKSRPNSLKSEKLVTDDTEKECNDIDNAEEQKNETHPNDEVESEGVIEGVVNGENEVEILNEQGQDSVDDKTNDDIAALVEEGNMEQLAALVLNGEGERLIGQQSDNAELQAFLDNVPVYMQKINRIHEAARNGSLKDLQAALDRRKFAIAKDNISPNGASPLHVSVIFGNTSIVRYLAGRFPETLQMTDNDGRTPLHYAATLADNGHYFNLLVHLGADMRAKDKFEHPAEYYRTHHDELSHKSLLATFGEGDNEILSDKDNQLAVNGQVDMPFFATEEGKYLASSLGDPLIKGLTEVANKRPDDPIAYLAQYLYNFANNRSKSRPRTQEHKENKQTVAGAPQTPGDNKSIPASIDVVTIEPEETEEDEDSAFNSTSRDEHGQSMLHFAAARSHGRNALFQLLLETEINIAFRDELYRTARDISIQANIPENTSEIDRYVIHIACQGDTDKLVELLLDGYDHITDIVDEDNMTIIEAVSKHNQQDTVAFLQSILTFEEKRERVHHAIRQGSMKDLKDLLADEHDTGSGKLLVLGKNNYSRCCIHIAVLCQQEEIVDYLANSFPECLKIGDNLERTALHYAMGIEKMETISRLLIKAGAKRVVKDLKGRQPTYYYLNKFDILRLQEEEETF